MYEVQKKNEGMPRIIRADTHTHVFPLISLSSSLDEGPAYFIELTCSLKLEDL